MIMRVRLVRKGPANELFCDQLMALQKENGPGAGFLLRYLRPVGNVM